VSTSKFLGRLLPLLLVSLFFTVACETPSRVDDHRGEAFAANKKRMIANPEAGMEPNDGVNEIEGVTVEGSLERYRRQQQQTPKQDLPASILIQGMPGSN
jgi:predicted metal-dependent hydrolase